MNSVSASGCGCAVARRTVTDYFQHACRRAAGDLAPPKGDAERAFDGSSVQFAVRADRGVVVDVRYRATTCVTLIAYAELLAEETLGLAAADALRVVPAMLVGRLPGVPAHKQERASLAVRAFWSAVARAVDADPGVERSTAR